MKFLIPALSLTLLAGCFIEPEPACSPSNCTGCCDQFDQCQVGSTQTACGSAGNACDVCVAPQSCQLGRCFASTTTGGGGGSGGGTGGGLTGGGGGVTGGGTGGGLTGGGGGVTGGGIGGGTGGGVTGGGVGGGGGGGVTGTSCNTSGVAAGCNATNPFSCDQATNCFPTNAACVASGQCGGGAGGGTGGGGGGSSLTCNTTGVAAGCQASSPFSCDAATSCFMSYTACIQSPQCGGSGGGGGTGGGGGVTGGGAGGGGVPVGGGGGAGNRTVTGRVTYDFVPSRYVQGAGGTLYFNQATPRPVRNAVVRVVEGASTVLATGTTAADGTYAMSFTAGTGALQVQVLARSVTPSIQIEDNTSNNATWAYGAALNPGVTTLDLHAAHGWTGSSFGNPRRAAPFAILDSMYTAARAFIAVRPAVSFPALKVNWSPNNSTQSGNKALGQIRTSHFDSQENEIYLLGLAGADIDEFDSHVIVHEWGHYFEENMSRSDSPGGPHGGGDVLDPRIAFGEAWGTAVAAMVLPETMYTDCLWSGSTLYGWGYDAETVPNPTDDPTPNAFSEKAVLRILYDLYDSTPDGAYDTVGVGLGAVYDVLAGPQRTTDSVTTIASFVTGLKAQPGANAAGINATLAYFNVGPVTSDFGAGDGNLSGMFINAAIPYSGTTGLGGGFPSNSYEQNQYYVFTGTGRNVIVTANSAQDVWIAAFRRGAYADWADNTSSGTESFSFLSQAGAVYVLVLQGYGQVSGNYNVSVSITSP